MFLVVVFVFSKRHGYILFHTLIELFSIVVAFAVFIVAWNARKMQDNKYLQLVGISYLFIGFLDLCHTLTYKGLNMVAVTGFPANQFWVSTRFLEAATLLIGFAVIRWTKKLNTDIVFIGYFLITLLVFSLILIWQLFPVCFIEGVGQTPFKIYSEYVVIAMLVLCMVLLVRKRTHFSNSVYRLLLGSIIFSILSECCFAVYISNYGSVNEFGHYGKLIAFFLIYKANVETGFVNPTAFIFKNLKEKEQTYRTLAENLPGLVLRFDQNLTCIYSNNALTDISFPYQNVNLVFHEGGELAKVIKPKIASAIQTSEIQHASYHQRIGDEERFYSIQIIPEFGAQNPGLSFLVICQDISALKISESRLQLLNQTKDKLFSVIAHDLKNPFTVLVSYSELIAKNAKRFDVEKICDMAQRMNVSAKQAYTLLENLLYWSSVQSGLLKAQPVEIQSLDLLEEASRLCTSQADAKDIKIKIDAPKELIVFSDKQMTATILRNLISNAIKFSFPNSEVLITAKQINEQIIFSVIDYGMGIAEEYKENLLHLSNSSSSLGTASEAGTGLGLILCMEFAELNKARIYFESEIGKGTSFFLAFPFR